MSDNQKIARNTGILYFRMLIMMGVTLYTSRIVLSILGAEDFGIYNVVAGIVAMFSFLNNALSISTSRFLSFEIGRKDFVKLQQTFSSSLLIHIILAGIILVLAETVGLWFLKNKIVVPNERMDAAVYTYHTSVVVSLITILQVPYNASIIAREKMNVYAFVGIIEVVLNLIVVFLLSYCSVDYLKLYALLIMIIRGIIALTYKIYCIKKFAECRFIFRWDKPLIKSLTSFSSWSLLGSLSWVLILQGSNILLNIFFGPLINAAYAISSQVNSAVNLFIKNFQTASRPQIVKLFANNKMMEMKSLVLNVTKFSYFLLLVLALPVIIEAKMILNIWLKDVPDFAILFVQFILIDALITIFDSSLYFVFNAIGRLKENAIISPVIGLLVLPFSFLLFKLGYPPYIIFIIQITKSSIMSFIVKPYLLKRYVKYSLNDFVKIFLPCILVTFFAIIPPILIHKNLSEGWIRLVLILTISTISIFLNIFYIGINKKTREKFILLLKNKFLFLKR
jgi:O-antigen/teichoic acid export membrane protein